MLYQWPVRTDWSALQDPAISVATMRLHLGLFDDASYDAYIKMLILDAQTELSNRIGFPIEGANTETDRVRLITFYDRVPETLVLPGFRLDLDKRDAEFLTGTVSVSGAFSAIEQKSPLRAIVNLAQTPISVGGFRLLEEKTKKRLLESGSARLLEGELLNTIIAYSCGVRYYIGRAIDSLPLYPFLTKWIRLHVANAWQQRGGKPGNENAEKLLSEAFKDIMAA